MTALRLDRDLPLVIAGGGPAGLSCAIALRRLGARRPVIVLERATFPREKPCAGGLGDRGWAVLEQLGAAVDVPAVRVHGVSVVSQAGMGVARPGHIGRVVRRIELDAALADVARAAGVELREGVKLLEAGADGRVVTDQGELQAAAIVGADGVGSAVRRSMGLHAGLWRAMVLEVDTPPVPGDPDRELIHFDATDRDLAGYYWDFPTLVHGEPLVCRGIYLLRPRSTAGTGLPADDSAELDRRLGAWMAAKGLSLQGLKKKRYAERGYAVKEAVVDGRRLLVGEAAGIDPISGEGIAQAIEGGARLARFLTAWDGDPARLRAWGPGLRRGRLGLDLRARAALVPWFYGRHRAALEAGFAGSPDLLHAGAEHWAGRRAPLPALARGLLRGAWAALTRR